MNISDQSVVSFHYTLCDEQNKQLETSSSGDPSVYLHGSNNIIRGLEQAMTDRVSGDSFQVTIEPVHAYGMRNESLTQRVPIKHITKKGKLKRGDIVQINTEEGARSVTILKVGRYTADIDANHPLAGQTLTFDINIIDVRQATEEELAHGHAHGVGGHEH
jgi:FKBP-type peptidyl-prolyl cis-trans isomerase SlyD